MKSSLTWIIVLNSFLSFLNCCKICIEEECHQIVVAKLGWAGLEGGGSDLITWP